MDEDKHPLFFEAENLTDREKDKIRRYFQIKREGKHLDKGKARQGQPEKPNRRRANG